MSLGGQGTKWHRNIAENFNRLSRVHERYTDDRQTDDRQTDFRWHIANVSVSSRSLKSDREDGKDDELPCVIGESEGDCIWRGSRRSVGSSFHTKGAAYWKERFVIFKEDRVGGRARVTVDKERVLRQGWTEIKLWRYWGWFVVGTLYVRERSLYLMRSFILSQCRDLRAREMREDFGVLVTARTREFWM